VESVTGRDVASHVIGGMGPNSAQALPAGDHPPPLPGSVRDHGRDGAGTPYQGSSSVAGVRLYTDQPTGESMAEPPPPFGYGQVADRFQGTETVRHRTQGVGGTDLPDWQGREMSEERPVARTRHGDEQGARGYLNFSE
ncbi:MAG: hypothetical protein HQL50_14095, partial [Magnetococcales bacterium]|nr:hypothetical protein [Magnetococcales bacterium]